MLPGGFRQKVKTAIHQNLFVGGQSQRSLLKNSDRLWNQSDSLKLVQAFGGVQFKIIFQIS